MQQNTVNKQPQVQKTFDVCETCSRNYLLEREQVAPVEELERRLVISLQERAFNTFVRAYCATLLPIFAIIFLQGFHTKGFDLPQN